MTNEAMRIAIAEACGWEWKPYGDDCAWYRNNKMVWANSVATILPRKRHDYLPDYCNDLNAMAEAWQTLRWDKQCEASLILYQVCGSNQLNHVVNATAHQRATAFLRTIRKYQS